MALSEFRDPFAFHSTVMFTDQLILPDNVVSRSAIVSAGVLTADRMRDVRGRISQELFGPAVAVAALTQWLHIVSGSTGALVRFEAAIALGPTGADRTITVDLQKSTGGAAFASVLSATIGFVDASVERVPVAATFSSTALTDGDILQVVVTVAGSAGNPATGLTVTLTYDEYN
jgi:hypothetical protein